MAYVFGIEGVPIFEFLAVISILLIVGLIVVLIELKKLSSLISEEKTDIARFEIDLEKFERGTSGKKSSNKLLDYVQNAMRSGLNPKQIETSFIQRGWPKQEVDNVLKQLTRR